MSRALGALAAYAAVFAVLGRAWLGTWATSLPGGDAFSFADDARLHTWVIGWIAHALAHEPGRLLDAPIHAPLHGQLAGTEHMASTQLLAVPVTWATGNPVLAMNAAIFASYLVTALAMRALLLAYGGGAGVAWVAGLVAALGPFRVPANVQSLQYVVGYLALVAWGLRRLRDEPSARRTMLLAVATTAGVLSSYYAMPMVAVVAGLAVAVELARPRQGRGAFLARAAVAGGLAAVPLLMLSLPYLRSAHPVAAVGNLETISLAALRERAVALGPLVFGGVTPALALAGVVLGWWGGRAGRSAVAFGIVVIAAGLVLFVQPWPLPALIAASPLRYLRAQTRFLVIVGFGAALLVAAGLEAVTRRCGPVVRVALLALAALLVVGTRGQGLSGTPDLVRPVSADRGVYEAVATAVRGPVTRPLLELPLVDARTVARGSLLPLGQIETDAMLGALVHKRPLVTGHSAYPPAHRPLLLTLFRRLPQSIDDLVDLTDMEWLLLRPADYWKAPAQRDAILRASGFVRVLDRDGWTLLRIPRATRHPEWVASLAAGPRDGLTLLGAPIAPVVQPAARIQRSGAATDIETTTGRVVVLHLLVTNAGATPWPVLAPPSADAAPIVRVVVRWGRDGKEVRADEVAFHRDVFPGETVAVPYLTTAPAEAGTYELTVGVEQTGGTSPFEGESAHVRVVVGAAKPVVVACLGDSNTAAGWPTPDRERWCEYAARDCPVIDGRPTRFVNQGIGGAVASAPFDAFELDRALAEGAERFILAFGTNDVAVQSKPPATLVSDLRAICAVAAPRPCWVATVPPTLPGIDPAPWNAAIRAAFGGTARVIDFTTGVVAVPGDGKHLDDASQRLVAERVRAALGCAR